MHPSVHPADFWTDALGGSVEALTPMQLCDVALATLAARRALDQALPTELIPDPVLDILLTLYTLGIPGAPVSNTVLGNATTVGPTVVERYLQALDQYGLVAYDAATGGTALTALGIDRVRTALRAIVRSQVEFSASIAERPVAG